MIRRARGVKRKQGSALDLANVLIATLNDYRMQHPDATDEQVDDAIKTFVFQVRGVQDGDDQE